MRRRAAAAVVSLATIVFIGSSTAPASADNFGSIPTAPYGPQGTLNGVYKANNAYHAVRFDQLGDIANIGGEVQWAIDNVYNPTDLIAYRDDSDPYPDVIVRDANYGPNGLGAWVVCDGTNTGTGGAHPNFWCRGQKLSLNSYYEPQYFYSTHLRRVMTCHELGHTVGLRHRTEAMGGGTQSCMFGTPGPNVSSVLEHEPAQHINPSY